MWSSGFIGSELGTRVAPTDTLLMWRFLAAAAVFGLGWLILRRPRLSWPVVRSQLLVGVLSQGVYVGSIVWSIELGVPLGTTALIAALQPLVAATVAGRLLGEHVRPHQWAGLAIGFAGVTVAVHDELSAAASAPGAAYLLPFLGMAGLLLASIAERRTQSTPPLVDALPIHVFTSAVVFTAVAVVAGRAAPPAEASFWLAVAWLIGLSTIGGYGFYWLSVRRHGVTHTSSLIYLTPPTTALWGMAMFGQVPTPMTMAGMVISLTGVLAAASQRPLSAPRRGRVGI